MNQTLQEVKPTFIQLKEKTIEATKLGDYWFPTDFSYFLQKELKEISDPLEKIFKLFQLCYPEDKIDIDTFSKNVGYREVITYLSYFDLIL